MTRHAKAQPSNIVQRHGAQRGVLYLFAALCIPLSAWSQTYPSKPIRIVAPFPPGGPVDALARVVAPKLSESFKQPVLVDNRPGAGGNLAADLVAKSAPDGYTILMTPNGLAISPVLYRKLPFDPARDFAAVTQLVDSRQIFVARSGLTGSVRDFIALAKANPGKYNSGTAGIGNSLHMTMEMITSAAGINVTSIPYKGEPAIVLALLAGEVDVAVLPTSGALLQHFKAGRLRALGHTSAKRVAELPDIPAIGEDLSGFVAGSWQGFFVPANTPKPIIDRIQAETARALQHPEVRDHVLAGGGREIVGSKPEEFEALFRADLVKFARIGREAKIPFQD